MRRRAAPATSRLRTRGPRGEAGSALVELTWLGLLMIVPLVYVVITLVTVQRSAFGATEAARAAGRAYVLSSDTTIASNRAYAAARLAMSDQGVELTRGDVTITCHPAPESCLQPNSTVTVSINLEVALPLSPTLGSDSAASIAVHASHVERFGTYREAGT